MSAGLYVSDSPVPARVDAAWRAGYEVGIRDGRNPLRLVEGIGVGYLFLRYGRRLARGGLMALPWLIVAAVIVAPFLILYISGRALASLVATKSSGRSHRGRTGAPPPVATTNVDGTGGEPF
jgi:hypothetical protein